MSKRPPSRGNIRDFNPSPLPKTRAIHERPAPSIEDVIPPRRSSLLGPPTPVKQDDIMARNKGRSSGRGGERIVGRGGARIVGRGISQGIGQAGDQGVRRGSVLRSSQAGDRRVGRGGGQAGDRGVGPGGSRGSSQGGGQAGDRGVGRGSVLGSSQGSGQAGDQGVGGASGIGSSQGSGLAGDLGVGGDSDGDGDDEFAFHVMHSPNKDSDGDDESSFHVAPVRQGCAFEVQVPEPLNREWIWIKDGEFSNQETSTEVIGANLKSMWSGPWDSWRDVSNEVRLQLFERFQWEEKFNAKIYRCWEKCIAGKFADLLKEVRNEAEAMATNQGFQVGYNMAVLIDFKPPWIRTETWKQMIDIWNTRESKAKSQRNSKTRTELTGGKHTLGSQPYMTAKRKAAKTIGRELSAHEMWKQSHCTKGSMSLDKDLSCSSSLVSDVDSEEKVQEENMLWVDDRMEETWVKYYGYLVEKYGDERSKHPKFDKDLWSRAGGGEEKGKVYGLSNVSDSYVHGRHEPEIEKLNEVIKDLVKEKKEEKERLNGIIVELMTQKEKDKVEKDVMLNIMVNIEAMLKTVV